MTVVARQQIQTTSTLGGLSAACASVIDGGRAGGMTLVAAGITLMKLAQRIREEFEEAPGLRVTVREGARFWGIDEETAEQVLAYLFSMRFLTRNEDQRYLQANM